MIREILPHTIDIALPISYWLSKEIDNYNLSCIRDYWRIIVVLSTLYRRDKGKNRSRNWRKSTMCLMSSIEIELQDVERHKYDMGWLYPFSLNVIVVRFKK